MRAAVAALVLLVSTQQALAICELRTKASHVAVKVLDGETVQLDDGRTVTLALFRRIFAEELERIADEVGPQRYHVGKFLLAIKLFQEIIEQDELDEFLTLRAYPYLD